jgi:hypothetical protein
MPASHGHADGHGTALFDRLETAKNGGMIEPTLVPLTSAADALKASDGRDKATGQFVRGRAGGPGRPRNPFTRRLASLRQAVVDAVTGDDLKGIVAAIVARAKLGDLAAAKLLLEYVLGKPAAAPSPDDVEEDEWSRFAREPSLTDVAAATSGKVDPATASDFLLAQRQANDTWKKLTTPAVAAAAGQRLLEEEGVCFSFRHDDGWQLWPPTQEESTP